MATTPAPPLLLTGNTKYSTIALSSDEEAVFERDLQRIASIFSLQSNLSNLLYEDRDAFLIAAGIAKASIGTNPQFTGLSASGNEIGMQLIRAITVQNAGIGSGGTPVLTWVQTYAATGWTNIFGSATTPVDLSQTGTGGASATNTNGRVVLAFGSLLDTNPSPKLYEYRLHIGQVDYGVQNIDWQPSTNLFYAKLMGTVIVPVNGRFYVRGNINPASGQDSTSVFGLAFATGDYLNNES